MALKGVTLQLGKEQRHTGSKAQPYRPQEGHVPEQWHQGARRPIGKSSRIYSEGKEGSLRWSRSALHTLTLSPMSLLVRVPAAHHQRLGRQAHRGQRLKLPWTHTHVYPLMQANLVLREQAVISPGHCLAGGSWVCGQVKISGSASPPLHCLPYWP